MLNGHFKFDICGRPRWGHKDVQVQARGEDAVDVTLPGSKPITLQRSGDSSFEYGGLPKTGSGQHVLLEAVESGARRRELRLRIESGNEELFNRWTGTAKLGG